MSRSSTDRFFGLILGGVAIFSGGLVLLIVGFLILGSFPILESGRLANLFTDETWRPGSDRDPQFGILPMLVASFLVTLLAIGIAAPLGVASSVFHHFYLSEQLRRWNRRMLELLAGVPSVVFGFWGLTVIVPAVNRIEPPGQSLLAAALVLGLMIVPTVALTSQAALGAIPNYQLLAAAGLGLGRGQTILNIALPASRNGIMGGILLAIARAVGETMAVVMVCGNIPEMPSSLFDPVRPVTATIALEMGYASSTHQALLFAAGLLLVLATGAIVGWLPFRRNENESAVG
ncbi:MAG: phosphate ABC transporter permease subunit PstC [Verrucomicrobiae bacterium]|nr:phosphate ABC transporter permease subunit PstC [Verrucomicrobiae bacterium]